MTIDEIVQESQRKRRLREVPFPAGCSELEVDNLRSIVASRFGIPLDDSYCKFLRLSNGLRGDGIELYGATPWFSPADKEYPAIDGLLDAQEGRERDGVD